MGKYIFRNCVICFVLLFSILSCSTKKNIEQVSTSTTQSYQIVIKPLLAEVDNLGRLYIVDQHSKIINYKPDLTEQYRYANTKSGFISSMDVTNPLRIVVFYNDFNHIKVLDNTLSIITELNLSDKYADVSACGVTNDGNLWIFDPVQFKLIKINDNGVKILESSNVNDFGMAGVKISLIREKGNYVVLCDKEKGFYIFDNLGQYQFHFEANDIRSFQFDGRNIYYFTQFGLKSYSINFKERMIMNSNTIHGLQGLLYVLYNAGDQYDIFQNGVNYHKKAKE
ncbi:MAG: hypothetical protein WBO36_11650 [Saprospiraceae bacterium]